MTAEGLLKFGIVSIIFLKIINLLNIFLHTEITNESFVKGGKLLDKIKIYIYGETFEESLKEYME